MGSGIRAMSLLLLASLASASDPTANARSLLFGTMPSYTHCLAAKDVCDWDSEEFRHDGSAGVCVAKRPRTSQLTWYNLDHGNCTVESANATHLVVKFDADSGVLFTSAPYKIVLDPRTKAELSNMRHYEGEAVAMSVHREGEENLLFLGSVESVNAVGSGVIVGKRIAGADMSGGEAPSDCVLSEVKAIDAYSAIGVGTCTSRGDGGVSIAVSRTDVFKEDGERVSGMTLSAFTGLNGAIYDENGDYKVFTIREAGPTHITGDAYFSTRLEAWDTHLGAGEEHMGACTFFLDPVSPQKTCEALCFSDFTSCCYGQEPDDLGEGEEIYEEEIYNSYSCDRYADDHQYSCRNIVYCQESCDRCVEICADM